MKHLYRQSNLQLPLEYGNQLKTFISGIKRIEAESVQCGGARSSGKAPLTYSKYEQLCRKTTVLPDGGFAHLFLATQWNLIYRSKSVQTLRTEHISFEDDSIGCTFSRQRPIKKEAHQKTRDMSLAIYLTCNPQQEHGAHFPGSQQKSRFGKIVGRLLQGSGKRDKQFGTHSIRKGVATFACSGCTGGSSIASVCLRCGWSIGGVQDRYLRYDAVGDQFLGRVVAGLPLNKTKLSVLLPHFCNRADSLANYAVQLAFAKLSSSDHFSNILKLCLASLVHHATTLIEVLPGSHALLSTPIFRNPDLLRSLQERIAIKEPTWIRPTGVPPHIEMYKQQKQLLKAIQKLPSILLEDIGSPIEEKEWLPATSQGSYWRQHYETTFEVLVWLLTMKMTPAERGSELYTWGGGIHILPEDFDFPSVDVLLTFKMWWLGKKSRGFPPFRLISPRDFSTASKRETLSKWKLLMKHVHERIEISTHQHIKENPTEAELTDLFSKVDLEIAELTPASRKRRAPQLKALIVLRLIQSSQKASLTGTRVAPIACI